MIAWAAAIEREPFPEMRVDAWQLVSDAIIEHSPRKVFVLFSGGNDSKVLTAWAKQQMDSRLDAAVFIDTGIAAPGVRDFAEAFCAERGIRLLVYETPYSEFVAMCREHGMPGPGVHRWAYIRLKERRIDELVADHKERRSDRVMLLAGARRSESQRRMSTSRPLQRDGAQVWVNPLIDWTNREMREFRQRHHLPESDVAALLHRSGECNCLAYPGDGERDLLEALWPEWFERTFGWLERELRDAGHRYWQLGMPRGREDFAGRLCSDCPTQLALAEEAA